MLSGVYPQGRLEFIRRCCREFSRRLTHRCRPESAAGVVQKLGATAGMVSVRAIGCVIPSRALIIFNRLAACKFGDTWCGAALWRLFEEQNLLGSAQRGLMPRKIFRELMIFQDVVFVLLKRGGLVLVPRENAESRLSSFNLLRCVYLA